MALNLDKGDIVLVRFPFSDLSQTKLRPALVLAVGKYIDEITLCFISSQIKILKASIYKFIDFNSQRRKFGLRSHFP